MHFTENTRTVYEGAVVQYVYMLIPSDRDSECLRGASTRAESLSGQTLGSIRIIKQITRGQ